MSVLKDITPVDLQDPKLQRLNWNFNYLAKQLPTSAATTSTSATGVVKFGTHTSRSSLPPASNIGSLYIETDRNNLVYQSQYVSGVATWVYVSGIYNRTQSQLASLATSLTTADTGLLVNVTDYAHILEWSGSAWQRSSLDSEHSDSFHDFGSAPTDTGWHFCDGSVVNYLKYDGTTGSRTLPNLLAAAYVKSGGSYAPTIIGASTPIAGNNSTTTNFAIGTGAVITVAGNPHTHTITLPGDPVANFELMLYYRI